MVLSGLGWISYYPDLTSFLLLAFLAGAPCNIIEICEDWSDIRTITHFYTYTLSTSYTSFLYIISPHSSYHNLLGNTHEDFCPALESCKREFSLKRN